MNLRTIAAALTITLAACTSHPKKMSSKAAAETLPSSLSDAVASPYRSDANRARDQYRHPVETLEFFGLKPQMTVVEIWPSAGWYTEILAPYLSEKGHYIAAISSKGNPETKTNNEKLAAWMKAHPDVKVTVTEFGPPDKVDIAPPGSADLVLTFRNVHNWMGQHAEKAAFKAFYKALRPGGILGVVEHRAATGKPNPETGYVPQNYVIWLAKRAGFHLLSKSEINANPKDTKDYPKGVWTLPPVNRHSASDDAKYKAIGESDRMTLKFIKPIK